MPIPYTQALKQFGANLKKVRKEQKISQDKLAEQIGIHRTYLSLVEKGERNPSLRTLYRLIKALKINSSELLPF